MQMVYVIRWYMVGNGQVCACSNRDLEGGLEEKVEVGDIADGWVTDAR